jgi:hypothetical protein
MRDEIRDKGAKRHRVLKIILKNLAFILNKVSTIGGV